MPLEVVVVGVILIVLLLIILLTSYFIHYVRQESFRRKHIEYYEEKNDFIRERSAHFRKPPLKKGQSVNSNNNEVIVTSPQSVSATDLTVHSAYLRRAAEPVAPRTSPSVYTIPAQSNIEAAENYHELYAASPIMTADFPIVSTPCDVRKSDPSIYKSRSAELVSQTSSTYSAWSPITIHPPPTPDLLVDSKRVQIARPIFDQTPQNRNFFQSSPEFESSEPPRIPIMVTHSQPTLHEQFAQESRRRATSPAIELTDTFYQYYGRRINEDDDILNDDMSETYSQEAADKFDLEIIERSDWTPYSSNKRWPEYDSQWVNTNLAVSNLPPSEQINRNTSAFHRIAEDFEQPDANNLRHKPVAERKWSNTCGGGRESIKIHVSDQIGRAASDDAKKRTFRLLGMSMEVE